MTGWVESTSRVIALYAELSDMAPDGVAIHVHACTSVRRMPTAIWTNRSDSDRCGSIFGGLCSMTPPRFSPFAPFSLIASAFTEYVRPGWRRR